MNDYTAPVITLSPEDALDRALILMRDNGIKRIVIVKQDVPVGIITQRDLGKFLEKDKTARTLDKILIGEVMTKNPMTIQVDTKELLGQCATRMATFWIGSIIVILPNGKLAGIITKADIVKQFSNNYAKTYQVKQHMSTRLVTCRNADTVLFALKILNREKVSRLVVTNNNGKPLGILTYRAFLLTGRYAKSQIIERDYMTPVREEVLVGEIMKSELLTVSVTDDLVKAANLITEFKVSGIPVIDAVGNLDGMISSSDIVRAYYEAVLEKLTKDMTFS